jgi:hypothetical protein
MYQEPLYLAYADYYNYTEAYMSHFGLQTETTQLVGTGFMLVSGITLLVYLRILMVCVSKCTIVGSIAKRKTRFVAYTRLSL